jgi:hypothetical protein
VAFGLNNPGFYTLMYGKVRPGYSPEDQSRPSEILRSLTAEAAAQGRLVVDSRQAAAHILATNIGLTLRLIILGENDLELSAAIREGVLNSITGTSPSSEGGDEERFGHSVMEFAVSHPDIPGQDGDTAARAVAAPPRRGAFLTPGKRHLPEPPSHPAVLVFGPAGGPVAGLFDRLLRRDQMLEVAANGHA